MANEPHVTTEAEEMYLITIARAIENGTTPPVAVSEIAKNLDVSGVSANQMIKKLEGLGLVAYTPYKGVELTLVGETLAGTVLRSRRLWGLFLSEHLGLTPERADEVACEMEHITPDQVADRLEAFLGAPTMGPIGKPIPSVRVGTDDHAGPVGAAPLGTPLRVAEVDPPFDSFLDSQNAGIGTRIFVLASAADGTAVIDTDGGPVQLSSTAAKAIRVVLDT